MRTRGRDRPEFDPEAPLDLEEYYEALLNDTNAVLGYD